MSPTATATRPTSKRAPSEASRQDQARQTRRRRIRAALIAVATLAVLATAVWLVFGSSVLAAQRVTVSGTKELTPEQVRAAAQVRLGQPLARQNLQAIAERAGQLPQLAEVRVTRDWPSAVGITVVERKPLLAVAQPSGFVLVDKTGVAYESRSAVPGGVFLADVNPDDRALLTEAGVVATALTGSLGKQIDRVAATNSDNITVRLDSGVVVTWGDSTNSALKAQLTTALLKQKPRTSIDVSSPHNPAIR